MEVTGFTLDGLTPRGYGAW